MVHVGSCSDLISVDIWFLVFLEIWVFQLVGFVGL
jgi:hypothetical protein